MPSYPCGGGDRCTGYKRSRGRGEARTGREWLGPLEHRVLGRAFELGLEVFRPADLGLGVDRRRLHDALRRLERRGFLERVARGVYRVRGGLRALARLLALPVRGIPSRSGRPKDNRPGSDGTRAVSGCCGVGGAGSARGGVCSAASGCGMASTARGGGGVRVVGPFFDNVRGYTASGYVHGDRGRVRYPGELARFERVSYAEVVYRVSGAAVPGLLAVYTNAGQDGAGAVRIEWRPPRGYVKRNGLGSAVRMFWEVVLVAVRAMVEAVLQEGPWDVRRRLYAWLSARLGPLLAV